MTSQPIHHAAMKGDIAALKAELAKGVDIELADSPSNPWTPLINAVRFKQLEAAKVLIEHKAVVDRLDKHEWTALHHACVKGFEEIGALLLDNGADINKRNRSGFTPLMNATSPLWPKCCSSAKRTRMR